MEVGPFFPGMPDPVGALLPALISIGIVLARQARSGLGKAELFWLVVFSLALSAALARATITPDEASLHIVPGATVLICYLLWRGRYISPGLAFALTYATSLPVDFFMAQILFGAGFNSECIGGAGWRDGLLVLPSLTALAVMYGNWRMTKVRRAGLFWFGQQTGGRILEPSPARPGGTVVA
ncbi:MAG: hypothetical protein ROZ09_02785 [Thiobacillus sp.]|jgi:hypothetical protein|uniref:hypothetical protein n=1 Tax=Thiobacillus sp. TaxID=924 RepID=UPI0028959F52|nr:hypothetical protein [Thiobacillus sp.]MDT3705724.1 hypothetical protein [Thiobacillus sp.]